MPKKIALPHEFTRSYELFLPGCATLPPWTYMVAPGLPSIQSMTLRKVEIAAIDPDFHTGPQAPVPDGICWQAPNHFVELEVPCPMTGLTCHGLTYLAITS